MVRPTGFLKARDLILTQLGISSEIMSQARLSPLEKSHCRAVLNWLQNYQPASDASNLEKVRGFLEAFHHLLELKAWEAAKHVAFARPQENPETRLAWQLGSWGYYQEQQELHLKLLDKVDDATNATCLNSLGLAYRNFGKNAEAIDCFQKCLNITRRIGDQPGEQSTLANLGTTYCFLDRCTEALECLWKSLSLVRKIGDRHGEGSVLGSLGIVFWRQHSYFLAASFFKEWLDISRDLGDLGSEAKALANLGNVYRELGDYNQAVEYLNLSLLIAREISDPNSEQSALSGLGNLYGSLRLYKKAIEYLQQNLRLSRNLKDRRGEAIALMNLGNACSYLDQTEDAHTYFQKSLAVTREVGDRSIEVTTLHNFAEFYYQSGDSELALKYCKEAEILASSFNLPLLQKCQELSEVVAASL